MQTQKTAERDWFTIFRTDEGNEGLRTELAAGPAAPRLGRDGAGSRY